jgi:hypothetical protein
MVEDIRAGARDGVIAYHQDRLTRTPRELEDFVVVCEEAGVSEFLTVSGPLNLANGDGVLMARVMAIVAAHESESKSRRVRRKNDERAEQGLPHMSGNRPFGFERDRITIRQDEATVIRELAARFLAGESVQSLTRWLQSEGVTPTGAGEAWRAPTVRGILKSPRNAGLREHRGEVVGDAVWDGIITRDQHRQILAILNDPTRRTYRTPRRYLLSGLVRCGKCGTKMVSSPARGRRRYGCRSGADFGGCGGIYISGDSLDQVMADAVLRRLDTPKLTAKIAGDQATPEVVQTLTDELIATQRRLDDLAEAHGKGLITMREWMTARKPAEAQLTQAKRKLDRLQQSDSVAAWAGHGEQLAAQWATLPLTRQSAIVTAILDHVVINPGKPTNRLDLGRVQPVWRV